MTNLLSDAENSRQVIGSLKKGLQGDDEIWDPPVMHQAILNNPALQGMLENINLQDLNAEKDFFLDGSMPEVADELNFSVTVTDESSFSDTDLSLHFSESEENTPRKEVEDVVDKVEKNFHGIVINTDKQMVPEVMNSLVKVAYCQAMGGRCNDAVCYLGRTYQRCMEDCCKHDNLGYCSVCNVIMAQYWMHSQDCEDEKCVVPFCMAFKERREEKGDEDFEFVYAYEVVRPSVEMLQKLFELTEVQKMQANGRALTLITS
ncbi:uncharacterized protein [Diadema antillarum]|uniref:uncharacterized protein n=1 Tax=Diadema antillarum TaxID=105358 RepID=UPI003A84B511